MDELRFRIDVFQPETIPMERLGEYMTALAALLGHEKSVHFVRLDAGSVQLVHRIDIADQPKVEARLSALKRGEGAADVVKAFRKLDSMLANDNAIGELTENSGDVVIPFPGRTKPKPAEYGLIHQPGSLDGIPIKVGGPKEMAEVLLQETGPNGRLYKCITTRDIVRKIAGHLFDRTIRVHGNGCWKREVGGGWILERFTIAEFEVLNDTSLSEVVTELRRVEGSDWRAAEDPFEVLRELRDGEDRLH
ncbi:hypothetical protein ACFSM5_20205 [Lacibacterium aquatile]|uniref:CYTH domain-containing protein n=1 Tax=Lacibacterium aquatile TaxID=1168082 RepID=A0ABW5DWG6_9PROT